jgi:hypothetical protein
MQACPTILPRSGAQRRAGARPPVCMHRNHASPRHPPTRLSAHAFGTMNGGRIPPPPGKALRNPIYSRSGRSRPVLHATSRNPHPGVHGCASGQVSHHHPSARECAQGDAGENRRLLSCRDPGRPGDLGSGFGCGFAGRLRFSRIGAVSRRLAVTRRLFG